MLSRFSHVWLFATPWTIARQAPLSMGFPRQEYWSGLPLPSPGELPNSEIKPTSSALAGRFFTPEPTREAPKWSVHRGNCSFLWPRLGRSEGGTLCWKMPNRELRALAHLMLWFSRWGTSSSWLCFLFCLPPSQLRNTSYQKKNKKQKKKPRKKIVYIK